MVRACRQWWWARSVWPAAWWGVGQAVVGAGLPESVADLIGESERGGVVAAGLAGLAVGEHGLAQAVERFALASAARSSDAPCPSCRLPGGTVGVVRCLSS